MVALLRQTVAIQEEEKRQTERLDLIHRRLTGQEVVVDAWGLTFHHIDEYFEPAKILVSSYTMSSFGLSTTDYQIKFDVVPVEKGGYKDEGIVLERHANCNAFDESNQWVPVLDEHFQKTPSQWYAPTLVISLPDRILSQSHGTLGLLHETLRLQVFENNPSYQKLAFSFYFRGSGETRWFPSQCNLQFNHSNAVRFQPNDGYNVLGPTEKAFQNVDQLVMAFENRFNCLVPFVKNTFTNSLGGHASIAVSLFVMRIPLQDSQAGILMPPAVPFLSIDCILNCDRDSHLVSTYVQYAKETFMVMRDKNVWNLPHRDWNNMIGFQICYFSVLGNETKILRNEWVFPMRLYVPNRNRRGYLWASSVSKE
jgi:hypothetical protein